MLSLPRRIRYLLVTRPRLVGPALRVFVRAIFAWQRRQAKRLGLGSVECGAVTFVQRFGDALNLNLHFHVVVPDAVLVPDGEGLWSVSLPPPEPKDVQRLTARVARRIPSKLAALGAMEEPEDTEDAERRACAAALVEGVLPFEETPEPREPARLSALVEGYSVHAGVAIAESDREGLERLCRYGLRPPFAEERLELLADGRLSYRLRRSRPDGRVVLVLEPVELLRKLAVLVPPKGFNLVRYHGVFAPASRWRRVVAELAAREAAGGARLGEAEAGAGTAKRGPGPDPSWRPAEPRPRRLDWAALLQQWTYCGASGAGAG